MLRITKSRSAGAAVEYFRTALRSADYYMEGREVTGRWHGLVATGLGLTGEVHDSDFIALLNNRTPDGLKLTARDRAGRIPMIDFTFNAPKSVSLIWALTQDSRLVQAHNRAVDEAMQEVERNMETRVRKGHAFNSEKSRKTGNALWASFQQDTARPVDGQPDPHLHTHCTLINATYDPIEACYKAVEIKNIAGERSYYEAVYHAALASECRRLGYEIERHGKWWDIGGVSRALVMQFSRRTQQIEKEAAKASDLSAAQKAMLGVRTRSDKDEQVGTANIQSIVTDRLEAKDRRQLDRVVKQAAKRGVSYARKTIQSVWQYGIDKAFERNSIAFEKRVMDDALRFGFGDVRLADVKAASSRSVFLRGEIGGRSVVTTQAMLAREERMISIAKKGRASCRPMGSGNYVISKDYLNERQRRAIRHIWSSQNKVMIVEGDAGVGKTSGVLSEAANGMSSAGYRVACFAPTSGAVKELNEAVDAPAYTVARLLKDTRLQDELMGHVFIVDEAGQLGVDDMASLLEIAERQQCRVVLSGDTKQHGAIAAGDAMRLLQQRCGLKTAQVSEIVRQKGAYKGAVETIARGNVASGWDKLEAMGAIYEVEGETRYEKVAADYINECNAGRTVLVVAPTHREKDAITSYIRSGLKEQSMMKKREKEIYRLEDTKWTKAERRDGELYNVGMVVKAFQNMPGGIKRGERLKVIAKDDRGRPIIEHSNGAPSVLPLDRSQHFKVYRETRLPLAAGDLVRVTEQGKDVSGKRLATGTILRVQRMSRDNQLHCDNGRVLDAGFGHLDYGYCSTSYAAQGRTVDTVIASMGEASRPAMSQEQFYVTASRGRRAVRIYTDDKDAVRSVISQSSERLTASEFNDSLVERKSQMQHHIPLRDMAIDLAVQAQRTQRIVRPQDTDDKIPSPQVTQANREMGAMNERNRGVDI